MHPREVSHGRSVQPKRRHGLHIGYSDTASEALATLRSVRHIVNASASVVEFGGIVALVARAAIAALNTYVRPKPTLATFDSVPDALRWLLPQTPEASAADSLAHYLRVVRRMSEALERGSVGEPKRLAR